MTLPATHHWGGVNLESFVGHIEATASNGIIAPTTGRFSVATFGDPGERVAVVQEREARTPYSADVNPALSAQNDFGDIDAVVGTSEPQQVGQAAPAFLDQQQARRHEIVFVDTDTPDYQRLVDDLLRNSSEERKRSF